MVDLSKYLEQAADAVKRRNYAMAVKIYGQVLSIQPDFGEARAGLRRALFQKAAQKPASKLTAMLFGGVHLLIGGAQRLVGSHAGAAKSFERYLAFDPAAESANLKLGDSLERAGFELQGPTKQRAGQSSLRGRARWRAARRQVYERCAAIGESPPTKQLMQGGAGHLLNSATVYVGKRES